MDDFTLKPATVPHQKVVHVHRDMPQNGEGNFLIVKKANFAKAYRNLNATAFVFWLYLASNKDGYNLALSPQAVNNEIGMPLSTCRDQINNLISKGYLVQHSEGSNVYDFYEEPRTPLASQSEARKNTASDFIEINNNIEYKTDNNTWRF